MKKSMFGISCIQVSELKDFQQLLLIFNICFFEIVGFIPPLSLILEGWLPFILTVIMWRKRRGVRLFEQINGLKVMVKTSELRVKLWPS